MSNNLANRLIVHLKSLPQIRVVIKLVQYLTFPMTLPKDLSANKLTIPILPFWYSPELMRVRFHKQLIKVSIIHIIEDYGKEVPNEIIEYLFWIFRHCITDALFAPA